MDVDAGTAQGCILVTRLSVQSWQTSCRAPVHAQHGFPSEKGGREVSPGSLHGPDCTPGYYPPGISGYCEAMRWFSAQGVLLTWQGRCHLHGLECQSLALPPACVLEMPPVRLYLPACRFGGAAPSSPSLSPSQSSSLLPRSPAPWHSCLSVSSRLIRLAWPGLKSSRDMPDTGC